MGPNAGRRRKRRKTVEKGKSRFAGNEIKGKVLGVIGLGAIGGKELPMQPCGWVWRLSAVTRTECRGCMES